MIQIHAFMQFYPNFTSNILDQDQNNVQNLSHFNENMTNVCNIFLYFNFIFCLIIAFSKLNGKDALIIKVFECIYSGFALP